MGDTPAPGGLALWELLTRAGSVSLAHPVASRLWEHKQIEFFSVLSENRKSQVASLCCQLGSLALRVQDAQRAWKAACVPRGCNGSTRVKGLEPFLINFLMHRSPPGDRAGSTTEWEVGDPYISSMTSQP